MQSPDTDPSTACAFKATRQDQSLASFQNVDFSLLITRDLLAGCSLSILQIEITIILYLSNTGGILQRKVNEIEWGTEVTLTEAS